MPPKLNKKYSIQSVNNNFVDIVTSSIIIYKDNIHNYISNIINYNRKVPLPYIDINTKFCSGIYINLTFLDPYYLSDYQKEKYYGSSFSTFLSNYYKTNEDIILNSIEKIVLVASFHYTEKTRYGSTIHNRFHLKSHVIFINNPEYNEETKILSNNNTLYINNFNGINNFFSDYFNTILIATNSGIMEYIKEHYTEIPHLNSICEEDGELMEGGTKNKKKNYKDYNVLELKSICKNKKIKNYSKLNKADLIKLLKNHKY